MDDTLSLYNELQDAGIDFYLWDMDDLPAATIEVNGKYGVFMDFNNIDTTAEERVCVGHEGGHVMTGATHKLNSPYEIIEQNENKADKWAIQRLVPKDDLDRAVAAGYTEIWNLAEYFNVTEPFMRKAVWWYQHGNLAVEKY